MRDNEKNNGVVLIVEDNIDLNNLHTQYFGQNHGYEVHTAGTLAAAREKLSQIEPDIIIMDVDFPDGNGLDFCEEIRDKTSAHIIVHTEKSNRSDQLRGYEAGCDCYLTKNSRENEIPPRVQAIMRRRREINKRQLPK
jgi:DNA-binding response OmpR family regulator